MSTRSMSSAHSSLRPKTAERCETDTTGLSATANLPVSRSYSPLPWTKPLGGAALHRRQHARLGLLPLGALALPLRQPGRHQAAPVRSEADRQGVPVGG